MKRSSTGCLLEKSNVKQLIKIAVLQSFLVNVNFPRKRPINDSSFSNNADFQLKINYFDGILQELWPQIM